MWYYWLLFFFIVLGTKVILAFVMIYLLLPQDSRCSHCDEPTLLMRPSRAGRIWLAMLGRRVQWRWCPRCGWEGMTRRTDAPAHRTAGQPGAAASTRR